MIHRAGEENLKSQFFRSERVIQVNQNWYFLTRGGQQEGPFSDQQEANQFLDMFLALMQTELADRKNTPRRGKAKSSNVVPKKPAQTKANADFPFTKVASVVKPPFKVRRIEFTAVAQDVTQVTSKATNCANDSFHFCCL